MNLQNVVLELYIAILIVLFIYGNNCLLLAYLHTKVRKEKPPIEFVHYPMVTVQLPVYNEFYVVERLIRKVAQLNYPRERLEIQVLDDSTDETSDIISRCIGELRKQGLDIYLLHRQDREGYKAGALRDGMKSAKGEFLAVFDADFLPDPDFLKRCIPHFTDPSVGMVQTRWGHVNEDYSLLTRALAIGIDGHFQIEQSTRHSEGLFLNFNGTAGVWRKLCIEESGGWQADTLTEDLDLSYRAQLRGWKLVFLADVVSPAEVPVQINAFKRQQFRWAKGSIQCAKKLLPGVISADIPVFKKIQALIHLTYYAVHPLMVALLLVSLPLIFITSPTFYYFKFFTLGTFGPLIMYASSQRELYEGWKSRLIYLPMLTIIGTGISVNNTKAVIEALLNKGGEFQRTPKFGIEKNTDSWDEKKYRLSFPVITVFEIALGLYALVAFYYAYVTGNYFLLPFLALYVLGYFYVSGLTILHSVPNLRLPGGKAIIIGILAAAAFLRLYRASMGDLSEDPYHHWFISAYLASGGSYADPLSGIAELWPPAYHLLGSGIIFLLGRDIFWLKLTNILFSIGGIYLVYRIAGRYSERAGLLAAAFLALNPFEILTSSTSYAEPAAVFFFLMAIYFLDRDKEKAAGLALLLGCATRYEIWLAIPFLVFYGKRKKMKEILYLIAPALVFIIGWSAYTAYNQGFFLESILNRNHEVLSFETARGAIQAGTIGRTQDLLKYFFLSSFPVYLAGLYYVVRNLRKNSLCVFTLLYLAALFALTATGVAAGSFRYFSLILPLLCIFGAFQVSGKKEIEVFALLFLVLSLPFYFNLFSSLDVLYSPIIKAGEYISTTGAHSIISNSPMSLYYSGLPAGLLLGPASLKGMDNRTGIGYLKEKGVDYIIYVESPPGELDRVFPGISDGKNVSGLILVYDPNDWEQKYGAKKVFVYRILKNSSVKDENARINDLNGIFKETNSYITSSPQLADVDGDGQSEIIAASDMLYVWRTNGSSLPGFPAKTEGLIASTPSIAYTKEGAVIFVGSDDNRLYAWQYNGSPLPGFPKITDGDIFSKPLILERNSNTIVLAGSDDGNVYAWYLNGSAVPGWPEKTGGFVSSSPIASDLNGDGEPEIIAGSWDKKLYVWYINGSLFPGFPVMTGDAIWATPSVADIDMDGTPDILAASDMVYAWDNRGKLLSGFPILTGSYIVASPLVQDIDRDGRLEIVVASDSLRVYNSSGVLKDGWPIYTGFYFWASPVAYDIDNDGQLEIITGDWSGSIYAFKPDAKTVTGFPKHTGGKIFASVAAGDIDNDGTAQIVAGSWDKNVYLWNIGNAGSYKNEYLSPPESKEGTPVLNEISISKEYGVSFVIANFSGQAGKPKLYYFGDDGTWHESPMVLSEGMYAGIIAPQKGRGLKYYISVENDNHSYRFPEVNYYEN
ncbi:MAG: glycosyltransferase [Candidatus Methanoperedens sp.]|nr:glycosyltransferase [Candidatus Methanoperedens sp.]